MNVFNRIFMVFLCLALIAGAASIIALAWTIDVDTINWMRDAVDWIDQNNADFEKAILSAVAAAVGFFALLILLMELTPKSSGEVKVSDLQVGNAVLSTASIGQRIEEAVRGVPDVSDVRTYVKAKRKGVAVALDLHVGSNADLAKVTDDASQVVRDVLTNRVHVTLAEPPKVRLHYKELRMSRTLAKPATPSTTPVVSEIPVDLRNDDTVAASDSVTSDGKDVPIAVGATTDGEERRESEERKPE